MSSPFLLHHHVLKAMAMMLWILVPLETAMAQNYVWAVCHPLMLDAVYANDESISTYPNAEGAIGVNIDWVDEYFIEQQRAGADWIAGGLCAQEPDGLYNETKLALGQLILDYGVSLQDPNDGSFPLSGDQVHSTSLFFEALARATYLLRRRSQPLYQDYLEPLRLMGQYMIDPAVVDPGRDVNLDPFNHRFFLRAAAEQVTSRLLPRSLAGALRRQLRDHALVLVQEGLAKQDPTTGIMPERDGFDFNYQAIGLGYLARYYLTANNMSRATQRAIERAMRRSLRLFTARVDRLGNIDLTDSTRINEPGRNGRPKSLDTKNILQAFLNAFRITGQRGYRRLANRMAHPNRPLVEYIFDRPGTDGQKNSGTVGDVADLFCRTVDNSRDGTPLGGDGSGLTGTTEDYAYAPTNTPGTTDGPFARTDGNIDALTGLASFTLSGWFRTLPGETIGGTQSPNVELFKTEEFKLTSPNAGRLRLYVNDGNVVSTNTDWSSTDEWTFFAVTYDGLLTVDNVKFYTASTASGSLVLSSTQTLDQGLVGTNSGRLYINRNDRSFEGFLENMRIHGNTESSSGALAMNLLQDLHAFDILEL